MPLFIINTFYCKFYIKLWRTNLSLKQASSSLTSSSAMLVSGSFTSPWNSVTGRGPDVGPRPGRSIQTTKDDINGFFFCLLCLQWNLCFTLQLTVPVAIIVTSFWLARLMNLLVHASVQDSPSTGITSDKQQWIACTQEESFPVDLNQRYSKFWHNINKYTYIFILW